MYIHLVSNFHHLLIFFINRSFSGYATEKKWLEHAEELTNALDKAGEKYVKDYFITAGYDSPFRVFERHNEVWFIAK